MGTRSIEFKPMSEFDYSNEGFYAVIFDGYIREAYSNGMGDLIVGNEEYRCDSSYFSGWCDRYVGES